MAPVPPLAPDFDVPAVALGRARAVRLALFDVDGVLTDGRVLLGAADEYKAFDVKDGHGLRMLADQGLATGILTGRTSGAVARRAEELGIRHVHQGCGDKLAACRRLLGELGLEPGQVAYMGDDVVDLPLLLHVGLALAPRDAHPLVRRHAHWVAPSAGGRGAAREACELLLHAQGRYAAALGRYLAPPDGSAG
jgi:3-deoxy-D-manno-octulosonate 8-phosphate phosphatase (KDO 8-P phosphatase)